MARMNMMSGGRGDRDEEPRRSRRGARFREAEYKDENVYDCGSRRPGYGGGKQPRRSYRDRMASMFGGGGGGGGSVFGRW